MSKKCSTHQRFIRKRNTTYEIGTLVLCYFDPQYVGMSRKSPQSATTSMILTLQKGQICTRKMSKLVHY